MHQNQDRRLERAHDRANTVFQLHNSGRATIVIGAAIAAVVIFLALVIPLIWPKIYDQYFFSPPLPGMEQEDVYVRAGESHILPEGTVTLAPLTRTGTEVCTDVAGSMDERVFVSAVTLFLPSGGGITWEEETEYGSVRSFGLNEMERLCWETHSTESGTFWVRLESHDIDGGDLYWEDTL